MNSMQFRHLRSYCDQHGIDYQEIDDELTYSENKYHLQQLSSGRGDVESLSRPHGSVGIGIKDIMGERRTVAESRSEQEEYIMAMADQMNLTVLSKKEAKARQKEKRRLEREKGILRWRLKGMAHHLKPKSKVEKKSQFFVQFLGFTQLKGSKLTPAQLKIEKQYAGKVFSLDRLPKGFKRSPNALGDAWLSYKGKTAKRIYWRRDNGKWINLTLGSFKSHAKTPEQQWREHIRDTPHWSHKKKVDKTALLNKITKLTTKKGMAHVTKDLGIKTNFHDQILNPEAKEVLGEWIRRGVLYSPRPNYYAITEHGSPYVQKREAPKRKEVKWRTKNTGRLADWYIAKCKKLGVPANMQDFEKLLSPKKTVAQHKKAMERYLRKRAQPSQATKFTKKIGHIMKAKEPDGSWTYFEVQKPPEWAKPKKDESYVQSRTEHTTSLFGQIETAGIIKTRKLLPLSAKERRTVIPRLKAVQKEGIRRSSLAYRTAKRTQRGRSVAEDHVLGQPKKVDLRKPLDIGAAIRGRELNASDYVLGRQKKVSKKKKPKKKRQKLHTARSGKTPRVLRKAIKNGHRVFSFSDDIWKVHKRKR